MVLCYSSYDHVLLAFEALLREVLTYDVGLNLKSWNYLRTGLLIPLQLCIDSLISVHKRERESGTKEKN